jgi:hypothetical protein
MKITTEDFTKDELGLLCALCGSTILDATTTTSIFPDSDVRNTLNKLKCLYSKLYRMFRTCHDDVTD